jgi:DNA mismatch repair protein MutS
MDAATRASLEILRSRDGGSEHTLFAAVQRTLTAAGARALGAWLSAPLTDPAVISGRQDAWSWCVANREATNRLRSVLRTAPDMTRALGRLSLNRGTPRDLAAIRDGLKAAIVIAEILDAPLPQALVDVRSAIPVGSALAAELARALADPAPARLEDGGAVRVGFDGELDAHRALRDKSRQVIATLQLDFAQRFGVASLKIKHHAQLGYIIEAPSAAVEKLRGFAELTLRHGERGAVYHA